MYIGLPMVIVGQLINLLTYGVLTKRDSLVTKGPYAWCRNPFYVGTFLTDFGFCVICDPTKPFTIAIIIGYALVQGTFYYLQIRKEEKLLHGIHGEKYEEYRRKVPTRLIPSIFSAVKNRGFSMKWSGSLALHNRIFSRALSAGSWAVVFWAVMTMTGGKDTYMLSFDDINLARILDNPWLMITAAAVVVAYVGFRIVEAGRRKKEEAETAEWTAATKQDAGE